MTARGGLVDEVSKRIADEIVLGRFEPGSRLEEVMLAEHFKVSRTPIREALKQLAIMGLVDYRPNRGSIVATITPIRLDQMFEAIGELEAICARYAALRMTEEERHRLHALQAEGHAAMQSQDMDRYDSYNSELHSLILQGAHNPVLLETTTGLRHRVTPYRRTQFRQLERAGESYAEHCGIVEAILAHDALSAYREMRNHVSFAHRAATRLTPSPSIPPPQACSKDKLPPVKTGKKSSIFKDANQ
ncbi:MAG: GntR family transcriptional regulator [Polaromonas sp.]